MQETERVMPFKRDIFKREPAFVRGVGGGGMDEKRSEEGVKAGEENRKIGKARVVNLY